MNFKKVEDIQRGISKPLQEMMFSSGDEDACSITNPNLNNSFRSDNSGSGFSLSFSGRSSVFSQGMDDEEEEDDDDEEDEDN